MKRIVTSLILTAFVITGMNCANKKGGNSSMGAGANGNGGLQSIYYNYDESFIRDDSSSVLQNNASLLKADNGVVAVEGNCDNRGTNEYNLALGQRRAESARDYLVNMGVSPDRVRAVSYGEEKPVCFSDDESCWQQNRRADFKK